MAAMGWEPRPWATAPKKNGAPWEKGFYKESIAVSKRERNVGRTGRKCSGQWYQSQRSAY